MYYYLIVTYSLENLVMDSESELHGPFDTPEDRSKDLAASVELYDDVITHVSLLKAELESDPMGGIMTNARVPKLTLERSFVADETVLGVEK